MDLSSLQGWIQTVCVAGAFILSIYSKAWQRYDASYLPREILEEWKKVVYDEWRQVHQTGLLDPYPDHNNNQRSEIKWLFIGLSAGTYLFLIGVAAWATLLAISLTYSGPGVSSGFAANFVSVETAAAIVALIGAGIAFVFVRALASDKRRYILAIIGARMGFLIREKDRPSLPASVAHPTDPKIVDTARKELHKPPHRKPPQRGYGGYR